MSLSNIIHSLDEEGTFGELGGKILGLCDLSRAKLPIPDTYFLEHIEAYGKYEFRDILNTLTLPFPIILRSSANLEDSSEYSFAGLFNSYICYSWQDVEENFDKMKLPNRENIILAYPGIRGNNLYLNCIIQPYLSYELSGVFITRYDGMGRGYVECVRGKPLSRILTEGEFDYQFYIDNQNSHIDIPESEILVRYFTLVNTLFPDFSYQYEWCIRNGEFIFLQKRRFLGGFQGGI